MVQFRRILVPHDFSEHASRALRTAARLVAPRGRILVLHVVPPPAPITDFPPPGMAGYLDPEALLAAARHHLARVVKKTVPPRLGARIDTRVELGDPHQCIVRAARGMDVVVLATAGRTGLRHLVIGSVAEKVVRHSPIPVLTLRPEVARAAARRR